jgi:hypothetical protein
MKRRACCMPLLVALAACSNGDDFFSRSHPRFSADLNLDGFADLVIGAPLHDGGGAAGARRGAVFVYYGSATGPAATPDLTIFGSEDGAEFGSAIAFVGDVNRGGAPDLLVGAPFDDGDDNDSDDGLDRGRAFLFFGGAALDAVPEVTITGAEAGALLGWSVARIADTNRDGYDDWVVGAPLDDGRPVPAGLADAVFTGSEDGAQFGSAVASAGDFNHGGAQDIAVGAPLDDGDDNASDDGADRGRVFVYYGGVFLDAFPDVTLTGDEDGARFGSAVAPLFDVNDDRIDDLLIGAPLHDAGAGADADRGEAYVFFGGVAPDASPDVAISGDTDGGAFGSAVGDVGDVNGDGERDFAVGAPLEDPAGLADAGSAYLFFGGAAVDAVPDLAFDGAEAGASFGTTVAGPGDFDGSGRDIAIGAPFDDADGNDSDDAFDRGSVFLFRGGPGILDAVPDAILDGPQDGALAGSAIAK